MKRAQCTSTLFCGTGQGSRNIRILTCSETVALGFQLAKSKSGRKSSLFLKSDGYGCLFGNGVVQWVPQTRGVDFSGRVDVSRCAVRLQRDSYLARSLSGSGSACDHVPKLGGVDLHVWDGEEGMVMRRKLVVASARVQPLLRRVLQTAN